jgi:hypothetical protein
MDTDFVKFRGKGLDKYGYKHRRLYFDKRHSTGTLALLTFHLTKKPGGSPGLKKVSPIDYSSTIASEAQDGMHAPQSMQASSSIV